LDRGALAIGEPPKWLPLALLALLVAVLP